MAALSVVSMSSAGVNLAVAACTSGGDTVANDGKTRLIFTNGSGGTLTVTLATSQTYKGLALADPTVAVTAGDVWAAGPFDLKLYGSNIAITYSGVTSLTVGAFKDA